MTSAFQTSGFRVLIVDDNEASRAFASAAMEDENCVVEIASCAREALALSESFEPDCVLLDVRMPDKDGFTTCRELRVLPGGNAIAIIFVTASRSADTFESAARAGADDFVVKPVMPNELFARVCAAVRAKALCRSVLTLYSGLCRLRTQLARAGALGAGAAQDSSPWTTLDELSAYAERVLELSGGLTRGTLEQSIAQPSESNA